MNEILIANLTLDTTRRNNIQPLIVPQGDYGARVIRAKLTDLGKPVIVENTAAVSIVATRSGDGESQAFSGSVNADGTVTVPVTQWMLDVPEEDVTCHIVVTGIGYQYSTTSFLIEPQAKAATNEIAPDDPRQDLVTEVLAGENTRRAAEVERVSNENARIAAENARQSAETQRLTDESTRITNEAQRVSAEASRDATFKSWAQDIASLPTFDGRISANRKRIENLESGIPAESFIIDDNVAYTKDVPENVAPNAVVQKVGGMTYKNGDTLRSAKVTEVKSVGVNLWNFGDKTFSWYDWVSVNLPAGSYSFGALITSDNTVDSHFLVLFANAAGQSVGVLELEPNIYNSGVVTLTAEATTIRFYAGKDYYTAEGHTATYENILLAKGSIDPPYTPYVEHTLPIPEAVRPANGINENVYDFIEWAKDGSVKKTVKCGVVDLGTLTWQYSSSDNMFCAVIITMKPFCRVICDSFTNPESWQDFSIGDKCIYANHTFSLHAINVKDSTYPDAASFKAAMSGVMLVYELAEPEVTDISDLITADNLVPVQSGGTMTPVNEYGYAVPSTIIYQSR